MNRSFLEHSGISFYAKFAVVYVANLSYDEELGIAEYGNAANSVLADIAEKWPAFEQFALKDNENQHYYFVERVNEDGLTQVDANWQGYYKGRTLVRNLNDFFGKK